MISKHTYAFRGLIAFVAFTNIGVAVKAFVEKKCLLNEFLQLDNSALPRVFGLLSIIQAVILIHCALYSHQKPIITLGISSSAINIFMYLSETLIFHSTLFDFRIILPCILNVLIIIGFVMFLFESEVKADMESDDEKAEILKFAKNLKKSNLKKHK